jgi:hypothetical protein
MGWVGLWGFRPMTHMGWILGPDLEPMKGFAEVYLQVL